MKTRARVLVVLASLAGLAVPPRATAWVAVRVAPRVFGAAAVGVAAGAVAGAAVASASQPSTVVVEQPAAPAAPPPPSGPPAVGSVITTLPSGCTQASGRYQCGSVWYQPYFGGNGVYYQVFAP